MKVYATLREPTEEMLLAGCLAISKLPKSVLMEAELSGDKHAMARLKMKARWIAMIEAALAQ